MLRHGSSPLLKALPPCCVCSGPGLHFRALAASGLLWPHHLCAIQCPLLSPKCAPHPWLRAHSQQPDSWEGLRKIPLSGPTPSQCQKILSILASSSILLLNPRILALPALPRASKRRAAAKEILLNTDQPFSFFSQKYVAFTNSVQSKFTPSLATTIPSRDGARLNHTPPRGCGAVSITPSGSLRHAAVRSAESEPAGKGLGSRFGSSPGDSGNRCPDSSHT